MTICKIEGCERQSNEPGSARGYCAKHYLRWRRHGDANTTLYNREIDETRCFVGGCGARIRAKGLCDRHYQRMRKTGSTDDPQLAPVQDWMAKHKTYSSNRCLIWPFYRGPSGRGTAMLDGRQRSAPFAMCFLAHGAPPTKLHEAAHSCGNGHKGCVNPRHMRWATRKQNERDKLLHGTVRRGQQINTSALSESDVRDIRKRLQTESGKSLAEEFGVSPASISSIKNRKSWAWLK